MITTWLIIGFFVILSVVFYRDDLVEVAATMTFLAFSTAVIGFLIIPKTSNYKLQIKTVTPSEVVKSTTTVYIEFEKYPNKNYTNKKYYESIDTNTTFYLYQYYDKYGEFNDEYLYLNLENNRDTIYIGNIIKELE